MKIHCSGKMHLRVLLQYCMGIRNLQETGHLLGKYEYVSSDSSLMLTCFEDDLSMFGSLI